MSFTSLDFALFFAIFFTLYWGPLRASVRAQNVLILVASYLFYGWWDWRFLGLIFLSSLVDFVAGLKMEKLPDRRARRPYLWLSLVVNLGVLAYFKYADFFLVNFKQLLPFLDNGESWSTLDLILPVGISFYTLQTLSYTFDVYTGKLQPTRNPLHFFAYVSFFPQLVAGPIERATRLLPQFNQPRRFTYEQSTDGLRQVIWGLFKKLVVADNLATFALPMALEYDSHSGSTVLLSVLLGPIVFYCDFSGYSDIAIGTARILGFDLMKNFDYPFFARNISEFWQKWHISLITWFRDYLIRWFKGHSKLKVARNIFIIFFVTGLWHGAAWPFITWGLLNACLFIPLLLGRRTRYRQRVGYGRRLPSAREAKSIALTYGSFALVSLFFHCPTVSHGLGMYGAILSPDLFTLPDWPEASAFFFLPFFIVEWVQRDRNHGLELFAGELNRTWRYLIYLGLIVTILLYGGRPQEFIYFQF